MMLQKRLSAVLLRLLYPFKTVVAWLGWIFH